MAVEVKYTWITEKNPPQGRPYRTFYVVGGFLAHVVSKAHEDAMRAEDMLDPTAGPRAVPLGHLLAFPRLPGCPAPDAP